jgi:hypothetical protein
MKIQVISKGKGKAEVVVHTETEYGLVSETRHVKLSGGVWTDAKGNKYTLD